MQPGDRLVCALVEPQELGEQFSDWLLHVTVVPWFRLKDSSESIAAGLERALYEIEPFKVEIGNTAMFGPRRNRPASLVLMPSFFNKIERLTRHCLHKKRAWLVDETTKIRPSYRPHVTAQEDRKLNYGDSFGCKELFIVEQKGSYKEIVKKVNLG